MPVPPSFTSRRFSHEPSRPSKEAVLAVGGRAKVRSHGEGPRRVPVTDEDGTTTLATLADGVEVEITAWKPRRSAGALYRVRTMVGGKEGGKEGWLNASSLEGMPRPRERPVPQPAPVSTRTKPSPAKTPRRAPSPVR